jgi:hypothetical protein
MRDRRLTYMSYLKVHTETLKSRIFCSQSAVNYRIKL